MNKRLEAVKIMLRGDEYAPSRLWVIVEAALEYFIALLTTGAYLARITGALSFSDSLTGILSSFVSLGCIFQLGSGIVFKRASRVKRRVIAFQMLNQLLFVVVYLTPVIPLGTKARSGVFLAAYLAAYVLINLVRSQKNSWMLSLIDDKKRGLFTAKKEIVSLISGMGFTYVMGSVIDHLEYKGNVRAAFVVCAAVIFAINALHMVTLILTKEKPAADTRAAQNNAGIFSVVKDKRVMRVILLCMLFYVTHYVSTPFYGAYQIKELGFSMRFISVLAIIYAIARSLISPFMGRLADRHGFVLMAFACFFVEAASFLVCTFTVPENGKLLFSLYNVLSAVAMAGINSALLNIVFGYAKPERRAQAIALSNALCGIAGFAATCAASRFVDLIQLSGNVILGMNLYPQQFLSAAAFLLSLVLILYTYFGVIVRERKQATPS